MIDLFLQIYKIWVGDIVELTDLPLDMTWALLGIHLRLSLVDECSPIFLLYCHLRFDQEHSCPDSSDLAPLPVDDGLSGELCQEHPT